jgi:molecular chaperone GrpE
MSDPLAADAPPLEEDAPVASTAPPPDVAEAFDAAAHEPSDDSSVEEAEQLVVDDLALVEQQRDDYLDSLRRLQADFENYKKRVTRQQGEIVERASEDLVTKLLPILDTIDLARQHGEGDAIDPVANVLFETLAKEGLERIDPVGAPFDPQEHDAVAHEDGDSPNGPEVVGLMRAGYRWRGRLLRPAMVTVKG